MKILIADDDPQIVRALRVTLGARGNDIVTPSNGVDAINQAISHQLEWAFLSRELESQR